MLQHPLRLLLERADLLDGGPGQAARRLVEVDDVVVEGVLGAAILDLGLAHHGDLLGLEA